MPKQYPSEFKKEVILLHKNGMTIKNIARKCNIAPSTVYRWLKSHPTGNSDMPNYQKLSKQKERQDHIIEIIRLSGIIDDVPLRDRLEMLELLYDQHKQYNVHELCEALNVARGTFYNHIFRRADRSKYREEQQSLMLQVQQIFDDSQQRFGAEKIRNILAENDIHVGKKRIREIMQELGLESVRQNAKKDYKKRQEYQRKNLLNRNFTASRQNEVWVSDITYFKIKDYAVYFCAIIDLFSRKVVGYRVSKKSSTHLVTSAFRAAFQDRGTPSGLIFHSDRGSQYVSGAFCTFLKKHGVKQSFSKTGCPYDNAVAETFFATFKKEEAYRREYSSEADFRKSVETYVNFYNNARTHQTLAYKTPSRFEELYGKEKTQDL